jgi:hypothetical protein
MSNTHATDRDDGSNKPQVPASAIAVTRVLALQAAPSNSSGDESMLGSTHARSVQGTPLALPVGRGGTPRGIGSAATEADWIAGVSPR